jgi:glycosyltransferase involved in cell wall biosynthesis
MRKLTAIEYYPGNQRPTSSAGVRVRDSKGGSPIASDPKLNPHISLTFSVMDASLFASVPGDSTQPNDRAIEISVVVPIYNEVESLPHLIEAIASVMQANPHTYEIICVDDGSQDGSAQWLKQTARERQDLKVIILRRNYGQTPAMAAGFNYARGRVIVTMDGDLQNDPADIPLLVNKLAEDYDLVSGWRKHRQDDRLTRLLPSKIANWIIGRVTGVRLHDYGCSLKAYRCELVADMKLYGELHRFLPALAFIEGARIAELPVRHHPRKFGYSKYGLGRTLRVVMDLLTISFMKKFLTRPMHVFGVFGVISIALGTAIGLHLTFIKLVFNQSIGDRPLLLLALLLLLAGVQLFCFGLLAELLMRTYHESQNRPIYRVREVIGGCASESE